MELPSEWEADVLLADGGSMHVRPILPQDATLIEAFHARQSPESIYYRYFSPRPTLSGADLERLTNVDGSDRMAFVGLLGDELVGITRYDRYPASGIAEVAFFTDDAHRGRGMATVLLEYLAVAARQAGLTGFVAQVLPNNQRMLSVFASAGFEVSSHFIDGVIEVELGIEPTEEAKATIEDHARNAYANSVARMMSPQSVAVIGVSRDPTAIGTLVVANLVAHGFTGRIHPIGLVAKEVCGLSVSTSVLDIPESIDVAVICVPAAAVRQVVAECGRRHVHGLVVISAGFSDRGATGRTQERELVAMSRRMGMRIVGPNSMGIINTAPDVAMQATFVDVSPRAGRIAVSSQSGVLGAAIIEHARRRGLGISTFAALGNRADMSNNDLLQYWEDDEATAMVLLYLEDLGNPINFARTVRRVARAKPVFLVKSAGTIEVAVDDSGVAVEASVDALLAQTGSIRVDTLEELFDVAQVLDSQPVARGRKLAILANAPGPAKISVDAARGVGLCLADTNTLGYENPVELGFDVDCETFGDMLGQLCRDPGVDAVLVLCTPVAADQLPQFARRIAEVASTSQVPVVATYLGRLADRSDQEQPVPVFDFPEAAVRALGRIARYGEWLQEEPGVLAEVDLVDRSALAQLLDDYGPDWAGPLAVSAAAEILTASGVAAVDRKIVASSAQAVQAANEIGWPVALKAGGIRRPSKREAGGVAVDLHSPDELVRAHARMVELLGEAMATSVVEQMAPSGVDVRVGLFRNADVGVVVSIEVDHAHRSEPAPRSLRILPLSDKDAVSMIRQARLPEVAGELFATDQSKKPSICEVVSAATVDLLLRLSALAEAVPRIERLVLDPVIVSAEGAKVTGVEMSLGTQEAFDRSTELRRLTTEHAGLG